MRPRPCAPAGGEDPVHYTWDPRKAVGQRLEVAPDCKHRVVDPTFLKGEQNLSLVLAELGEEESSMEHSVESKLEQRMAETITEVNRVDENKVRAADGSVVSHVV